jgi:hypothetical protein
MKLFQTRWLLQGFLIYFVKLCIQQWAGQVSFATVPRDCSHSPIVFDLSFVPPVISRNWQ